MTIKSKSTKRSLDIVEKMTGSALTLGRLIWAIRESEEMSQVDFAKQLNISKQHLCDLEHNRKTVSPKLAARYARKLRYSEEQFVRLCLQDQVNRAGLNMIIEAKHLSSRRLDKVSYHHSHPHAA
jgi:DNA-binding transcriptional regulator YiaG